jgi:hypothetical protein
MIRYTRGSKVVIEAIFYDTSQDIAYPTSVHLTIAYPDPSTGGYAWPLSGDALLTTSNISMTTPTTASTAALVGVWRSTFNSAKSARGVVHWTAVPSTNGLIYGVVEGKFELRGGPASSLAVLSTLG